MDERHATGSDPGASSALRVGCAADRNGNAEIRKAPLAKALQILRWLSEQDRPATILEAAAATGLNVTTARRLLGDLHALGVLDGCGDGRHGLSASWVRQCAVAVDRWAGGDFVRRALAALVRATGQAACFYALDRTDLTDFLAECVHPPEPLAYAMRVGTRGLLHAGPGKSILAHMTPEEAEAALSRHALPRLASGTTIRRDALSREMEQIRHLGYALSRNERQEGSITLSAPVFANATVIGAVCLAVPEFRADMLGQASVASVRDAACALSAGFANAPSALAGLHQAT